MSETSPRLGLPYLCPSQAQKHVTHNEALQLLDQVVQLRLTSLAASTPPAAPEAGECHSVAAHPTGAWEGHGGQLAYWDGVAWQFVMPAEGWLAWDAGDGCLRVWQAGDQIWAEATPDQLPQLGIGIEADDINRLAVAAPATLLSHSGTGHQVKVNKATAGDTASLLFQSDWAGHAELGLVGDTALSMKTSADGSTWQEVMRADPQAGQLSWSVSGAPQVTLVGGALQVDVPLEGSAVQNQADDATSGRVMTVGAFGLGERDYVPRVDDFDATDTPSGFARFTGASVGTAPPGLAGDYGVLLTWRYKDTNFTQIAISKGISDVGMWVRKHKDGSFGAWSQLYDQQSILGPVSQSGGIPTGAVIERGSNSDGTYVRFADGTQICTREVAHDLALTAAQTWAYAMPFVTPPVGQFSADCADPVQLGAWYGRHGGAMALSATHWQSRGAGPAPGATGTIMLQLTAIGRWI